MFRPCPETKLLPYRCVQLVFVLIFFAFFEHGFYLLRQRYDHIAQNTRNIRTAIIIILSPKQQEIACISRFDVGQHDCLLFMYERNRVIPDRTSRRRHISNGKTASGRRRRPDRPHVTSTNNKRARLTIIQRA